jgi:hypothetical protein
MRFLAGIRAVVGGCGHRAGRQGWTRQRALPEALVALSAAGADITAKPGAAAAEVTGRPGNWHAL